jgi:cytochrome P450
VSDAVVERFPLGAGVTWAQLEEDPAPILERLRREEPVTWLAPLGGWAALRYPDCDAILRDEERFTPRLEDSKPFRIFGSQMLNLTGDRHRRARKAFEGPFRLRPVRDRYTELVRGHCDDLLAGLAAGGADTVEFATRFAQVLPIRVMRDVLGLRVSDAELRTAYDDFAAALGDYKGTTGVDERAMTARKMLEVDLRGELRRLRATSDGSALGAALSPESDLSEDEIVSNALVIMFGGIETTETLILNTLYALVSHPEQLQLVRAKRARVADAIEETLRWASPLGHPGRTCVHTTVLGDVTVHEGDSVFAILPAANKDPDFFDDPQHFDLERPRGPRRYLSFGHGPHFCLGFHLAKLEARLAIEGLCERFPSWHLDAGAEPPRLQGFSFRKPRALHLRLGSA